MVLLLVGVLPGNLLGFTLPKPPLSFAGNRENLANNHTKQSELIAQVLSTKAMVLGWLFGNRDTAPTAEEIVRRLEETRIERELALREAIVERKNAFKIAQARERFPAVLSTGILSAGLSVAAGLFHKNFAYIIPVPAFATFVLHEYHYAYGNKIDLVLKHTEKILEDDAIVLSTRPVSTREVHARREEARLLD